MSSNPAFAFVVNSILNNNKNVKILSKAKKENEISINEKNQKSKKTNDNDEIDLIDEHGKPVPNKLNDEKQEKKSDSSIDKKTKSLERKHVDKLCLIKPNISDDHEKEKKLKSIATKGVVQLFNVVREKQTTLKHKLNKAGSSERKRVKALKEFTENDMDELKSDSDMKNQSKVTKKKWPVLQEDFLSGAKFKDWDKDYSSDDDDNN